MKYEMRHAKKPDNKSKVKFSKKKIIAITLGSIAGIAVIVLCVLYFQVIFSFISSKIDALSSWFSGGSPVENSEISDEVGETPVEGDNTKDNIEEESPEESEEEEEDQTEDEEETGKSAPVIELEVYEGPLYSSPDDICYYRVKAIVTGEPSPQIVFSKDDSLGSLGPDKAQVNLSRDNKTYVLTATADNSEGEASDTLTLTWNCNRSPDIKSISLSSDTLYVGQQYEVSVDASDLDGDTLSYTWSVTGGSIVDNTSNPVKWNTPAVPGDYGISVVVNDGNGNNSETSAAVYVGEIIVEQGPKDMNVPKKEGEGGYVEFGGATHIGANIYAGDSAGNKPCGGFVSFDISNLGGSTVESASLTFSSAQVSGDPLSFFYPLKINVLDWGAESITQGDFELVGIFIASYDSSNITCSVSKLKEELQNAINEGKSRFQIRIRFSGPFTDDDGRADGWEYSQSNVNLKATVIQ